MASSISSIRATLDDQARDRYPRIPFRVEPGTPSVEVVIRFDGSAAGIDLGCEGDAGWRGWSGGARTSFVIAAGDATPGYLPGPLEPGEWNVVLGLHRLPAEGVTVEVEVLLPASRAPERSPVADVGPGARRGSTRGLPAPDGLTWFAGDFHAHTLHSDGELGISQLAALGAASGLDFLAVTDHNTTSHHAWLPAEGARHGITLLPGQEVTTARGHANAFGDIGFIDFRRPAEEWVAEVDQRGGVLSINHPIAGDCSWLHALPLAPRAVELWHSTWFGEPIATSPLAWFRNWDSTVTLLGGSDFHRPGDPVRPGTPTTWVAAEDASAQAILAGVAAGRTAITGGLCGAGGALQPELFLTPALVRIGDQLVAVDAAGTVLVDGRGRRTVIDDGEASFPANRADGPFCLVRSDRSILALSA